MAALIYVFSQNVPVSGSAAAPNIYNLTMPALRVRAVEFMIPYGNRGAVKFGLGAAGTKVIPYNAAGYISGDDETIHWPLSGYIDSGAWQLFAYNDGSWPHLIQVRFLCDLIQSQVSSGPAPLLAANVLGG